MSYRFLNSDGYKTLLALLNVDESSKNPIFIKIIKVISLMLVIRTIIN